MELRMMTVSFPLNIFLKSFSFINVRQYYFFLNLEMQILVCKNSSVTVVDVREKPTGRSSTASKRKRVENDESLGKKNIGNNFLIVLNHCPYFNVYPFFKI
jgi:hypothetical protein